tara:strand:+ start:122 stop:316 length:195 start_codon:yes stop_codon:yes gene_type:complete
MKNLFGMSDNEFILFLGGWIIIISFVVLRKLIKNNRSQKEERNFKKFMNIMSEVEKLKQKKRKK